MASTIFFNGRVTAIPGAYTEVDATGLAVVGLGATGIVACIGEAEGGEPDTVIAISNPGKVARTFRDGDLREAGNILFDPSKDPDIPGGAQEIKFVKVNPATQSTFTLVNIDGDVLVITSRDFGLFTTQINITISDGTNQGKAVDINQLDVDEVFDDIGGDPAFTALYTPGANGATTMVMDLDNAVGISADFTKAEIGLEPDYVGTITAIDGLDGDKQNNIGVGNVVNVVSSNAADTTQSVFVIGINNGTGLPDIETLALNGTTPVVGGITWTSVHGVFLSAVTAGTIDVDDNTTTNLLYQIVAGQTVVGGGTYDFNGDVIENGGSTISLVSDGASTQIVIAIGTDENDVSQAESITLTGTTPVISAGKWNTIQTLALGYVEAAQDLTLEGLLWNQGELIQVVSSDAGDTTQTISIYGLDGVGAPQSEVVALNGTTPVAGTATWSKIMGVVLSAAAAGTITVSDSNSIIVPVFSMAPGTTEAGIELVDNVVVSGTALTVDDDGGDPKPVLLIGLDANGASQVVLETIDGTPQVTAETWSALTAIVTGHILASRTVTVSGEALNLALAAYPTVSEMASFVNGLGGWAITVGANAGPIEIGDMDNQASTSVLTALDFFADLAFVAQRINDESQLVTATIVSGATGAPSNGGPFFLAGGIEGVTTFAEWQSALDLLRDEIVNTVVVLTDDAAVHAAAVSHAVFMAGPGRKERDVVLGAASGISFTAAKAAAVALNTRHARLNIQDIVRFNVDGVREQFPPYFTACIAAGMQAGSSPGTPLTFKFLNVLDVVGDDSTYTLQDDANELIQSGLHVIDKVPGVGFRWLRGVTTHLIDDNIAFVEASANEAVNVATFNLRTVLEAAAGNKGFAGTVNAAASIAIAALGDLSDPQDPIIVAWRNLTIELTQDVMTVDVELAPVTPVNFVPTTIHLVTATVALAA